MSSAEKKKLLSSGGQGFEPVAGIIFSIKMGDIRIHRVTCLKSEERSSRAQMYFEVKKFRASQKGNYTVIPHSIDAPNQREGKGEESGAFAVKRKRGPSCDAAQPSKRPRARSPCHDDGDEGLDSERSDVETTPDLSSPALDNYPDSDNEIESDIEVHEEDDIPHPNSAADLAHWLKLTPARRGVYHSTKIGKELSVQRGREVRKRENDRAARETREEERLGLKKSQIHAFFSRAKPTPSPEIVELEIIPPAELQSSPPEVQSP
ncbi:hypothetical protein B0H14DRAFT_2609307 [Mycena olivaceomarginata]|nr:hypothetical protein B0H14DRAFT_2609307 [Mycena olivaceomarginata]